MNVYQSSGDLGDIIFSLAAVQHCGPGTYILVDRPWTARLECRAHLIEPLLRSQSYIYDVRVGDGHGLNITHDFSTFRSGGLPWGKPLSALHAEWIGVKPGAIDYTKPWLSVEPTPGFSDRVILARSPRYNTPYFPWKKVVEFLGDCALFVGLESEHRTFCDTFGSVEYLPTKNLLDVAGVISGAHSFIGNQSSPNAIAEGLKVRRVLEVATHVPDCCIGGGDVQYVCDGGATIINPRTGETLVVPPFDPPAEINRDITPPGGWQYKMPNGDVVTGMAFNQAIVLIRQAYRSLGADMPATADIEQHLIKQTCDRLQGYGKPRWFESQRNLFNQIKQLTNKL